MKQYTCDTFKYIGSIIHEDEKVECDITSQMNTRWVKWKQPSGIPCDKKISHKQKGKFYHTVSRPIVLYGAECWDLKKKQEKKATYNKNEKAKVDDQHN